MKYNTQIGSGIYALVTVVCFFSLVFTSCNNQSDKQSKEKNEMDTIVKSDVKKLPGISFEDQLELERNYPDSISIIKVKEFYGFDFGLISDYCKIYVESMDLNGDSLPDKIISLDGEASLGKVICRVVLFNRKDYFKVGGSTSQIVHNGPLEFRQIILDEMNQGYLLVNTEGWGSGFYAEVNMIYKIENDSVFEVFNYDIHSSYDISELFSYDQYIYEITNSSHQFLNDSTLKLDIEIHYENATDKNNIIKSQVFKESSWFRWDSKISQFVIFKSTNPEFIEKFPIMHYFNFYIHKLQDKNFKLFVK